MEKKNKSEAEILRQKAEELLKRKQSNSGSLLSESEMQRLNHQLEVHQIELEMQNDELELARSAAQLAAEKYIEFYDSAPSGHFALSKSCEIIDLNLSGANMLGKERSSLKNGLFNFYISNDTKPVFNLFLEKAFNNQVRETCEVCLTIEGSLPRYVYLSGFLTANREHCLVTLLDITERKNAEEELISSEIRYRRLFESAKDGILILDAETGMIKDVNPFLIELLGYSEDQFQEKAIWEIGFFRNIVANHDKFLELQQKKYVRYEDLPLEASDGRKINVEFVSNVYFEGKKKVVQCNIRDITERKRNEEALKASEAKLKETNITKDRFFSIIAHDVKSPFNSILGFSEILKEEASEMDLSSIQQYADIINKSSLHVYRLLDNLLSWARIQQGQMPYNPSTCTLKEVTNEVIELLTENANSKKITIKDQIPDELMGFADVDMLKTIVRNLVSNAIKFTSANGIVELRAIEDNGQLQISVRDNGKGMNSADLGKLFRIDTNYSTRGTEDEMGTGLGLILCKEFVDKHGGKIWVESEEGNGTTFYFTLPLKVETEEKTDIGNVVLTDEKENKDNKLKILIAEDDEASEILLEALVKKIGKKVFVVKTGFDAVEACHKHPDLDLVLMDIQMPKMDGYEATRQIRQFNKSVVIIAQTAFVLTEKREKAMAAGCNDYITKPIRRKELMNIVDKYFTN